MKVLVRTRRVSDDPAVAPDVEVVNAETGEQVRGVTSLCFSAGPAGNTLDIRLHDFDVEIDQEAQLSPVEGGIPKGKYETHIDKETGHASIVFIPDEIVGCEGIDHA